MRITLPDLGKKGGQSYIGFRIFLIIFSVFFMAGGIALTITLGKGIIEKGDWLGGIFLAIPVLFAALGAGGIYISLFLVPSREKASKSISEKADSTATGLGLVWIGYAFFGVFLIAGVGTVLNGCCIPMVKIIGANTWTPTPCEILDSKTTKRHDDDGPVYGVSVSYRYWVEGHGFRSNRFSPIEYSTRKSREAVGILKYYAPGSEHTCYVNPRDPTQSVLVRGGFPWEQLGIGLIGLIFAGVGGGGIYFVAGRVRKWREKIARAAEPLGRAASTETTVPGESIGFRELSGPKKLKPKGTPLLRFLATLALSLVWNGFVAVFIYLWWNSETGEFPWWSIGFIGIIALLGLLFIGGIVGTFMALFNPRPVIGVDRDVVRLGDTFRVSWGFSGREQFIPVVKIYLEGAEVATSGAGEDSATATRVFAHIPIADLPGSSSSLPGSSAVTIPPDTMHSLEAAGNEIRWSIRLIAEISRTRRLDETFPLEVAPMSIRDRKGA